MIQNLKEKLLEMLERMEGLPADQKKRYETILASLRHKNTVITSDQYIKVSLFVTGLFSGDTMRILPMNNPNRKLVRSFSDSCLDPHLHLDDRVIKPTRSG